PARADAAPCSAGPASEASVGPPTQRLAWRATPLDRASVYRGIPFAGGRRRGSIDAGVAEWFLVLKTARAQDGGCWVRVRRPGRPNHATGWVEARQVLLRPTPWRLEISLSARRLVLYNAGRPRGAFSTVVGAPSTPTPRGLFSIVHAWRGRP